MESELTPGVLLGSLVGPVAQTAAAKKAFEKRFSQVRYLRIAPPFGLFQKSPEAREIYQEGIYSHLFGMTALCRIALVNVLKTAIKGRRGSGKYISSRADDLLNWAARSKPAAAHAVAVAKGALLKQPSESGNLEIIRYFSEIINELYPFQTGDVFVNCPHCGHYERFEVERARLEIGGSLQLKCMACTNPFSLLLVG